MDGLKHTMAAVPAGTTRRVYGTAYWDGSRWYAKVKNSFLDPRWSNQVQPLQGMPIAVDISKDEYGQASAMVVCGYVDQPFPSTGTVLAVGITDIAFTGEDGTTYTTDRFIGTYSVGDLIFIDWSAWKPTILGIIPSIEAVHPAPPPVPSGTVSGETVLIPTASDTWGVGGWGRWATSRPSGANKGEDVYTGTQSGYTVTGSWFYGAPKPELEGKTLTSVQFLVPPRLPGVGAYNDPVTIYLYAHTSQARPGSDVPRVAGPHPVTIQPGSTGGLIDLPLGFGPHLAGGGGLSIAGGPYVGFKSRLANPEYGKAILKWSS